LDRAPFYDGLWAEAGDVLFWSESQLSRLRAGAGPRELEIDARSAPAIAGIESVVLLPDELLWMGLQAPDTIGLWQQVRGTGERRLLGGFAVEAFQAARLARSADAVLVAGAGGVLAVSVTGEGQVPLQQPSDSRLVGLDSQGAYYTREFNATRRGGHAARFEVSLAPADGGTPRTIWRGAAGKSIDAVWEQGASWLAVGRFYLGDGASHAVVVEMDARGGDRVLACDPGYGAIVGRPILQESSLFLVSAPGDRSSWQIVQVPVEL
jgi:hypothetical protein